MVPSGIVSLTKLALAVHNVLPLPVGAVGGALVEIGVSDASMIGVLMLGFSVGVNCACRVFCACTVIATEVAMVAWLEAEPQAVRMRARMVRNARELYFLVPVILGSFRTGHNYTRLVSPNSCFG